MDTSARPTVTQQAPRNLDREELLHLALQAMNRGAHEEAIDLLKRLLQLAPDDARAKYLLAAEHAQIGMTERAIAEFNETLALAPELAPARFQLGLLYLCNARVDEALRTWEPLEKLEESNPFLHFKRGLACLAKDDFTGCTSDLERGIRLNTLNAALNADMRRVLDSVAAHLAKGGPGSGDAQPGQILLSAYTRTLN